LSATITFYTPNMTFTNRQELTMTTMRKTNTANRHYAAAWFWAAASIAIAMLMATVVILMP